MTAERAAAEEAAARDYARLLRHELLTADWPRVNGDIIERWSFTALLRIKRRAWLLVYTRDFT